MTDMMIKKFCFSKSFLNQLASNMYIDDYEYDVQDDYDDYGDYDDYYDYDYDDHDDCDDYDSDDDDCDVYEHLAKHNEALFML